MSGRTQLPSDWEKTLGIEFRGLVRYERKFNPPGNLPSGERLFLIIEGVDARASVAVNGEILGVLQGTARHPEFELPRMPAEPARLMLDVELPAEAGQSTLVDPAEMRPGRENLAGGPIGEVRLEVRGSSYLSPLNVAVERGDQFPVLRVSGVARGDPTSEPLSLVVSTEMGEMLYQTVRLDEPFSFQADAPYLACWDTRESAGSLTGVEFRLIGGNNCLWRQARFLASRSVTWNAAHSVLQWGGREVNLPLSEFPYLDPHLDFGDVQRYITSSGLARGMVVLSRRILPDCWYAALDHAGIGLVQAVPNSWREDVCARIAHHPSILAWTDVAHALPSRHVESDTSPGQRFLAYLPWIPIAAVSNSIL